MLKSRKTCEFSSYKSSLAFVFFECKDQKCCYHTNKDGCHRNGNHREPTTGCRILRGAFFCRTSGSGLCFFRRRGICHRRFGRILSGWFAGNRLGRNGLRGCTGFRCWRRGRRIKFRDRLLFESITVFAGALGA